jgi:NAD(P) transhydrogenase
VIYLTGITERELYGRSYRVKESITSADLMARTRHVIDKEEDVVRSQLIRNGIELHTGHGRFINKHTVTVDDPARGEQCSVRGQYIVIATGTKPARPPAPTRPAAPTTRAAESNPTTSAGRLQF